MEHLETLYDMCDMVNRAIKDANDKIRNAGGKLSAGDVDYIDKLTHTLKSIKTVIAMQEETGYSGLHGDRTGRVHWNDGRVSYDNYGYDGNSYARGRGSNAKRDSMGRYSSERGYSRDDVKRGMLSELRELMQDAPDDQTRQEFQRFVTKLENM